MTLCARCTAAEWARIPDAPIEAAARPIACVRLSRFWSTSRRQSSAFNSSRVTPSLRRMTGDLRSSMPRTSA